MTYNFIRFPGGKPKAVTLSYDDGSRDDVRFCETIDKYGLKCTFNLVGNKIEKEEGLTLEEIRRLILDKGHEIAVHGFEHRAQDTLRPIEGIRDILDCRLTLETTFGRIIRGMAFADRSLKRYDWPEVYDRVISYVKELDIVYCRNAIAGTGSFDLPKDWYNWVPTVRHAHPEALDYADKFIDIDLDNVYISARDAKVFFLWGHSFEFERANNWELLDEICTKISGKDDIWYATNIEIYDYVTAYRSLVYSADSSMVYNPTLIKIWFDVDGKLYVINPGETLEIAEARR